MPFDNLTSFSTVSLLKVAIADDVNSTSKYEEIDGDNLTLWKVFVPSSDLKHLGALDPEEALDPLEILCDLFSANPEKKKGSIVAKLGSPLRIKKKQKVSNHQFFTRSFEAAQNFWAYWWPRTNRTSPPSFH